MVIHRHLRLRVLLVVTVLAAGLFALSMPWGDGSEAEIDVLGLPATFLDRDFQSIKQAVESQRYGGESDPNVFTAYCYALRELGEQYIPERLQASEIALRDYVGAVCNLEYGRLATSRDRLQRMVLESSSRALGYLGLLKYASTSGNSRQLHEILEAVQAFGESPAYLSASAKLYALELMHMRGEFDQLEAAVAALQDEELAGWGYPNFLISPLVRRNAFDDVERYIDKGIAAIGQAPHLLALRADTIRLTKGNAAALSWLRERVSDTPEMWELSYTISSLLLEVGTDEATSEAVRRLGVLIDQRSRDFRFLIDVAHLALDYQRTKEAKKAIDIIASFENEIGASVDYQVLVARGHFLGRQDERGMSLLQEVLQDTPLHVRANVLMVEYGGALGLCSRRQMAFSRLLHADPWDVRTLWALFEVSAQPAKECCAARFALQRLAAGHRFLSEEMRTTVAVRLVELAAQCHNCRLDTISDASDCRGGKLIPKGLPTSRPESSE